MILALSLALLLADPAPAPAEPPAAEAAAPDRLLLRGRITQASYPGGFYRYAVAVGQNQFMVDDTRRLAVGENVGIGLPVSSLHFFSRRET